MIKFVKASQYQSSILIAKVFYKSIAKALKTGRPCFGGTATGKTFEMVYPEIVKNFKNSPELNLLYPNLTIGQLDTYWCKNGSMGLSYKKEIYDALVSHIPGVNFTIPYGKAQDPNKEATYYSTFLNLLHSRPNEFYVQNVGTGENGHIAFNEPGTPWSTPTHFVKLTDNTIEVNAKLFTNGDISLIPKHAITTGMLEIQKSDLIIFGAFGNRKAEAVRKGFIESPNENVPLSVLQNMPCVLVCVDEEASTFLPKDWFITPEELNIDELIDFALSIRG